MGEYLSRYSFPYVSTLLYMLQSSDYKPRDYVRWLRRTKDFRTVRKRQKLDLTPKIRLLKLTLGCIILLLVGAVALLLAGVSTFSQLGVFRLLLAIFIVASMPVLIAYLVLVPLWMGETFIQKPKEKKLISEAVSARKKVTGTVIAIVGSYGKTTMKEALKTVLSESKSVIATPGNQNTVIGTSRFLTNLTGQEEIIICELGESHVGDIKQLCEIVKPDIAIITGINEAHLETFETIENTISTIYEVAEYVDETHLYRNIESKLVITEETHSGALGYNRMGVHGWEVSDLDISLRGTKFTATKDNKTIWVESHLIGVHQIGPLTACVDIADRLGLSVGQIAEGLSETKAFDHRMQPYKLNGAVIIDDTYNGNVDGITSGLMLLKSEKGRRIYVTPGLVEQGKETERIHKEIGVQIADSCDVVVLMKNSVSGYIKEGLMLNAFKGKTILIDDPLTFYTNLDQFVANGDVVLMQNDWTDNYH